MKVEIKKIDKLKRILKIEVEAEEFLKKKEEIYTEIGKTLKVSGFRPGEAPIEILEKYHSKYLQERFLEKAIPLYYQKAIEKENLFPVSLPRVYDIKLSKELLSFCADIEVKPSVEIEEKKYKNIKIKDREIEVKDTEIEKILDNLKATIEKITTSKITETELSKWLGYPNFSKLKEAIKIELFMQKLQERRKKIEEQIFQHLLNNIKVEIPTSELENEHKRLLTIELYNLKLKGVPEQDIDKYKKDVEEKLKLLAEEKLKLFYILEAIAKKEKLNIDKEDHLEEIVLGFILSLAQYEIVQ